MSGLTLTPTNAVTDTVRPPAGKYRFMLGDGTNGTILGALYRMDSTGAITAMTYSDEQAQDAIGALFIDSTQIDFTYNDAGNTESARILAPIQPVVTGASKVYSAADIGKGFRRSNAGAAMTDTLPTLTAADNGFSLKVQNLGATTTETLTFTGAGGETFGESGATSYVLKYGCRQTFIWDGNTLSWRFDAGNGNLLKTYAGVAPGDILTVLDTAGVNTAKATSRQILDAMNDKYFSVNILDFGGDNTGATSSRAALTAALAYLPFGGMVYFPSGTYHFGNTVMAISTPHITIRGASKYNTVFLTSSLTEDILRFDDYYQNVEDICFRGPYGLGPQGQAATVEYPTKTAGYGVNNGPSAAYTRVRRCSFQAMYDGIRIGSILGEVDDCEIRYFKHSAIVVDHNSDHQISKVTTDNNAVALPTGGGIQVLQTASLLLRDCNVIHANFALDIAPAAGVTIPSIKGVNCFFDTSAVGLNMTAAGFLMRSEFTNCWFSSMTIAGIRLNPTTAGGVNGVTFVNCDVYQNVGGTTVGVDTNTNVAKWKMIGCSIAGWTTGINLVAGTNHYPTLLNNTIGAVSAFGNNGTGVMLGAGAYKGILIRANDMNDNTTASLVDAGATSVGNKQVDSNNGYNPITPSITANVAHTNAETVITQLVLPPYALQPGSVIRINAMGQYTQTGITGVANTIRARIGTAGTTADAVIVPITGTSNAAAATAIPFMVTILITCRTAGSAGSVVGMAKLENNGVTGITTVAGGVIAPSGAAPAAGAGLQTVNTTVQNVLSLTGLSGATTSTLTWLEAEILVDKN